MARRGDVGASWDLVREASRKPTGYPYTRYVNRNISRPLTLACWHLGLRPNQVSLISAVTTASGLAVFYLAAPDLLGCLVAYALLVLGYALDASDGQLARVTGTASKIGEWFDHSLDACKLVAVPLVLGLVLLRVTAADDGSHVVAAVAVLMNVVAIPARFFVTLLRDALLPELAAKPRIGAGSPVDLLMALTDYGILMTFVVIATAPSVFLITYTGYGVLSVLALTGFMVRTWFGVITDPSSERVV